jgi:hypothetical protein
MGPVLFRRSFTKSLISFKVWKHNTREKTGKMNAKNSSEMRNAGEWETKEKKRKEEKRKESRPVGRGRPRAHERASAGREPVG